MRLSIFLLLSLCLLIQACASMSVPSAAELASADYGTPISQAAAEQLAAQFFQQQVEQPESTQFNYGPVQADWIRDPQLNRGAPLFGYTMTVELSTKNSLGRYTNAVAYKLMFRDGQLQHIITQPRLSNDVTYMGKIY